MPKYKAYPTMDMNDRQWPSKVIDTAPQWCSVDLRDGNQALATPMSIDKKLRMFDLLLTLGFKEIEIGFPSASQIEYDFLRTLIEKDLIPDDVTVQVLTQSRRHLIERTVQSLKGAKKAIIHLYNSTSEQQRRITFKKNKEEIKTIAIEGTQIVVDLLPELEGTDVTFQYSPESFTGTEMDYALEVCEAVKEVWDPKKRGPIIINLPATVEMSTPNIYADQIEWFSRKISERDLVKISLHTHNDRGTGVAATELALMAGADRVEGTLFGNGERTGNVDIVTLALNMQSQGVDSKLDFSKLPEVRKTYEHCTDMDVHDRHPYAGDLVFTAFSGSHQDAISKGMEMLDTEDPEAHWDVPYLPIDPKDIGRTYQAIIRINSQSGKGGVAYVLDNEYGIRIPRAMQMEVGSVVNEVSDKLVRELTSEEILDIFEKEYLKTEGPLKLDEYSISKHHDSGDVSFVGSVTVDGSEKKLEGKGNGPIDAFLHAINTTFNVNFEVAEFEEQAIGSGTQTEAAAFIAVESHDGQQIWGVGKDTDTSAAHFTAILNAINRSKASEITSLSKKKTTKV
jgi:2-isopropylmalate synthase